MDYFYISPNLKHVESFIETRRAHSAGPQHIETSAGSPGTAVKRKRHEKGTRAEKEKKEGMKRKVKMESIV